LTIIFQIYTLIETAHTMETHYVSMPVVHQNELSALYELVYSVASSPGNREEMSVVSHSYVPTKRMGYEPGKFPEVILQNRYTLNPALVRFSIAKLPEGVLERPEDLFRGLNGAFNEVDRNPRVMGRNYEEGVHNLFTTLQESLAFMWTPYVRQLQTGRILASDVHAYKWFKGSRSFLRLGTKKTNGEFVPGIAWQSDKLVSQNGRA